MASGSGGQAGSSQGGAGAAACTDPDAMDSRGDGTATTGTTTGTNGSFTDSCDADGNLVEYTCELAPCLSTRVAFPGGRGGTGGVALCPTGTVLSRTVDCAGHCKGGACFDWCAEQGDELEFTAVSAMQARMAKGDYELACDVVFQREGYDCLASSLVGRTLVVTSVGACNAQSTTFGWDDPEAESIQECTFTCTFS